MLGENGWLDGLIDLRVGLMADCWAEKMAVKMVGSRAGQMAVSWVE